MSLANLFLALVLSFAATGCASSKSKLQPNWGKSGKAIQMTKTREGPDKGWGSRYAKSLDKKKATGTDPEAKKATPPEIPKGARDPKVENGSIRVDGEQIVIPDRVLPEHEGN